MVQGDLLAETVLFRACDRCHLRPLAFESIEIGVWLPGWQSVWSPVGFLREFAPSELSVLFFLPICLSRQSQRRILASFSSQD